MATVEAPQHTRLYISPLTPALLSTIIPPSLQPSITNLSYHHVPTFPEKAYAYLELPAVEAQRIRTKLNGVTFKGMKVKIEEARPDKKRKRQEAERVAQEAEIEVEDTRSKRPKKEKKRKEEGVFKGVELPEGREVKRGWTQPSENDKKKKSKKEKKDLDHKDQEMLFKTHLPANVASKTMEKGEKKKKERSGKGKPGRDAEIKEFTKTTKYPTFLRSGTGEKGAAKAVVFVDGKGWVDDEGNVIEDVVPTRSTRPRPVRSSAPTPPEQIEERETETAETNDDDDHDDDTSVPEREVDGDDEDDVESQHQEDAVDAHDEEDEAEEEEEEEKQVSTKPSVSDSPSAKETKAPLNEDAEEVESDESESISTSNAEYIEQYRAGVIRGVDTVEESNTESDSSKSDDEEIDNNDITYKKKTSTPPIPLEPTTQSTCMAPPAIAATTEITAPTPLKQIHPLEALYKRPSSTTTATTTAPTKTPTPSRPLAPIKTGFSFFNGSSDNEAEERDEDVADASDNEAGVKDLMPPQTPFTQRDMEWRGMRSAAPTPDTAAISRRLKPWDGSGGVGSDENEDEDELEQEEEEEGDDDEEQVEDIELDEPEAKSSSSLVAGFVAPAPQAEQTEFEKHFWAMRGEYNRSWKTRKREARKEQRQSENRRTGFGR